jgi:four helix bundle protein
MASVHHYRELVAWQLADSFKQRVFALVMSSPQASQDLRYRSQLLDAASAVSKDIAEGFKRFSAPVMRQFCDYALGSLHEADERLKDGLQLKYFRAEDCAEAFRDVRRCTVATIRLKKSQKDHRRRRS